MSHTARNGPRQREQERVGPQPRITVEGLWKEFDGVVAVSDFSLTVRESEVVGLLGPSGSGKTTALRCIAGLERATRGRIRLDGRLVDGPNVFVPPERRGVGMMFQSFALWPHMRVFENIAYGLRLRRQKQDAIQQSVMGVATLMGLQDLLQRYPHQLSGGQQQRVALARSLVVEPKVLLFDEPLSNLDAKLRTRMRVELRELLARIGIAAVYVTHDQVEAMTIAETIIVMSDARIIQQGTPEAIYERPAARFVADFVSSANFIDGTVVGVEENGCRVEARGGSVLLVRGLHTGDVGATVLLAVAPENVHILTERPVGEVNVLPGKIIQRIYLGRSYDFLVDATGLELRASLPSRLAQPLKARDSVYLRMDPADLIALARDPAEHPEGVQTASPATSSAR